MEDEGSVHLQQDAEYMRRIHGYLACKYACIILLKKAPFHQRDLRKDWVRRYVWPTRFAQSWQDVRGVEFYIEYKRG